MTQGDAAGRERRDDGRHLLDAPLRALTRLTLAAADGGTTRAVLPRPPGGAHLPGPGRAPAAGEPMEAVLVDFSRLGFRFRTSSRYDPGTRLSCRLVLSTVEEQALAFDAEVRWCLRLGGDQYEGGARILGGAPEERLVVFERFLRYHQALGSKPA